MAESEGPSGLVLQVQRMSTEDGPGLRSTAFLKGCPLACVWCHNPESIAARPEVQWIRLRCIGCGRCVASCGAGALERDADGAVRINRGGCTGCGVCAEACPSGAMELLGERRAAAALAVELLKDSSYFKRSDRGGVTLSGGEASVQPKFAREVLRLCAEGGAHTALDTCGCSSWESLSSLYPYTRLLLWDLKEIDGAKHEEFTGLGNALMLENLERTAAYMCERSSPEAIWVRTPVVPGATDTEENLYGLGLALGRVAPPRLERWELLAFNNLCADKYRRLGLDWPYAGRALMTRLEMERLAAAARRGLADGGRSGHFDRIVDRLDEDRAGKELKAMDKAREELTPEEIALFSPTEKIGLVAVADDRGEAHVALLSSIMARGPRKLLVGEFSRGLSKEYMQRNKKVGFLVMGLDLRMWRGAAEWKRLAKEGPEYEEYNKKPMFRYNTYFGINTVHYLDLVRVKGPVKLPMAGIVCASLFTMAAIRLRSSRSEVQALSPYARSIVDGLASLSFLSCIGPAGYPLLVPVVQARTAGPALIAFSPGPFGRELAALPDGSRASIFSMNLGMESVLSFGRYEAPGRRSGPLASVAIDRVYNSMPTAHGQVYPPLPLAAYAEA